MTPATRDVQIVLVGGDDRTEFQRAIAAIEQLGHVTRFPDPESAEARLAGDLAAASLIVIAQSYPGQFSAAAIDRLRRAAPLARLVGLLGSWCEGEMRTGKPWPGVIRLYWHQWSVRSGQELQQLIAGHGSTWGLPITATDEERLLAAAELPLPKRHGLIAIHSRERSMADWLADACGACGYATVWLRPSHPARVQGATAIIYDGSGCEDEEIDEISRLAAELTPVALLAILHFPRIEHHERALAAGAAAVFAKPISVDDLVWQLEEIVSEEASIPGQ